MVNLSLTPPQIALQRAYSGFLNLGKFSGVKRNKGLKVMAKTLKGSFDTILEANTLDLETSRDMAVPDLLLEWLKLTPERLQTTVDILEALAACPDPLQRVINAPYQLNPAQTYCQLMPLGVIALIYETFPELAIMMAGFALKSGNALILRGCGSASHSNSVIAEILTNALESTDLPQGCLEFLPCDQEGSSIQELVTQSQYLNLIIPYGRPSLIEQVTQLATAPVLKSAMGNCYLYWGISGDIEMVRMVITESHASEPDPVNAIEKVLISQQHSSSYLVRLFNSLEEQGFKLKGDQVLVAEYPDHLTLVNDTEWETPYLSKMVAFKVVTDLSEAIALMNRYSSGHADCIVTESYAESHQFAMGIDSALVYVNTSSCFSRHPKQGESVFLGVSNQKGLRRGLIGLESLTTLKQVVQGSALSLSG